MAKKKLTKRKTKKKVTKKAVKKGSNLVRRVNKNLDSNGMHYHEISANPEATEIGGSHSHLFIIDGLPLISSYNGEHSHPISLKANRTGAEDQSHKHTIKVNGDLLVIGDGSAHIHELDGQYGTNYSGSHRHILKLEDGTETRSLLPGDLLQTQIRKRVNLEIQSIHVSTLFITNSDEAVKFMDDRGFNSRDVEKLEDGFRFRQLSRDRFKEESLKELELSNGVIAMVGILDPDKMGDANATFDSLKDIDPTEQMLKEEQVAALANLRDAYSNMIGDMKEKAERFIPILNQFIDLSDEFVKNEPFQSFLSEFLDSFNVLNAEIERVDTPSFESTEKVAKNFEDHIREIAPVLKDLSDVFCDSEGFDNFGRLLMHNQAMFKQMILNLPIIRSEGNGTAISKSYNDYLDLENMQSDELEHLSIDELSSLKIKELDLIKLRESDSLNDTLNGFLKKFVSNGEVNINLGSGKPEGYIGIDKNHKEDVDICYNVEKGIPLPSDSVNKIRAVDFLQSLDNDNREMFMSEVSRVLKNDGILETETPSTDGRNAFMPTCKSFWNEAVFKYFTDNSNFELLDSSTIIDEESKSATVKVNLRKCIK